MREAERIGELMRRMLEGQGWHGPGLLEVLKGVTAAHAAAHPIPGAHSIQEIVRHMIAWHEIAGEHLAGRWNELTEERNWPPAGEVDEAAWRRDVERLREVSAASRKAIVRTDEAALDLPLAGAPGTAPRYLMLHGLIHHDAWHAGQVSLLRRALGLAPGG